MPPFRITAYTVTSCLGRGVAPTAAALHARQSGLVPCRFETADLDTWVGEVEGLDDVALPAALARFDCRNNRLAELALAQDDFDARVLEAIARYGASRVGVFLGTSTSGILQTELAYRARTDDDAPLPTWFHYAGTHNTYSLADYVSQRFGLAGPAMVVSAACASSAKVFGNASRMIAVGRIDAALVGGVDSLCLTTLYGFRSLELVSRRPAQPYGAERDGLSIGEAGAFALVERDDADATAPRLLGVGESSDAHHMSTPHPGGLGARSAIEAALDAAGLAPADIGYVNLHGTATRNNDAAEDRAVVDVFGTAVPISSTKGATGHTLGAAGGVEAVVSLIALRDGFVPAGVQTVALDAALRGDYRLANEPRALRHVLSNSFGFGGANCSLVFASP